MHPFLIGTLFLAFSSLAAQSTRPGPLEKIGGDVSAPVVLSAPEPGFPHSFFHPNRKGHTAILVHLVVDRQGKPENVYVLHSDAPRYDKGALEAVQQYRFKPAMKAGEAVPVEMNVQVNFDVY